MSTSLPYHTADVFTTEMFGGNQLAVFPHVEKLDTALMQRIARELNLSETVFVFPPDEAKHTRKLRIFTPAEELPFAGHPTLGTAFVLAAIGEVELTGGRANIVFEEGVGPVPVRIEMKEGKAAFCELTSALLPQFGPPPPPIADVAAALSLRPDEVRNDTLRPLGASCGVPYFFVPLRDLDTLARARVDVAAWEKSFSTWWSPALVPLVETAGPGGASLRMRMFAPSFGIQEDPATGSAAAALAGYLAPNHPAGPSTLRWTVDQGVEMGRPSRLYVECDRSAGRVVAVRVGGSSVMVAEGKLTLQR